MRHTIKVNRSYTAHVPDGNRCDGKDVNQKPCEWWDPGNWMCRSGEIEHYDRKKAEYVKRVGPYQLNRLVTCVKRFGRGKSE